MMGKKEIEKKRGKKERGREREKNRSGALKSFFISFICVTNIYQFGYLDKYFLHIRLLYNYNICAIFFTRVPNILLIEYFVHFMYDTYTSL